MCMYGGGAVPQGGVGDRHLVTVPQEVVGDRLPWGGERQGGGGVPAFVRHEPNLVCIAICASRASSPPPKTKRGSTQDPSAAHGPAIRQPSARRYLETLVSQSGLFFRNEIFLFSFSLKTARGCRWRDSLNRRRLTLNRRRLVLNGRRLAGHPKAVALRRFECNRRSAIFFALRTALQSITECRQLSSDGHQAACPQFQSLPRSVSLELNSTR